MSRSVPRIRAGAAVLCTAAAALVAPAVASADLYISPTGSDANACTQAAPCRSVDRAYRLAAPGTVVQAAAGSYASQTVNVDSTKTSSSDVVVQPAAGAAVSFGGLTVRGSHLTVRDIATGFVSVYRASASQPIDDVTIVNGKGTGLFVSGSTRNVTFKGGSYGGITNVAPVKIQNQSSSEPPPSYTTFDGVDFHDAIRDATGYSNGVHMECMYAADVQHFTVRNSTFRNCAIFDLFLTTLDGTDPASVTLENNVFDATASHAGSSAAYSKGYYALSVSAHLTAANNFVIRNNAFGQPIDFSAGSYSNFAVTGNVGPQTACAKSPAVFSHNVWSGTTCSSTDRKAALGFVDPANYDYRLTSGAAGVDAGDPANFPATDHDGAARPVGAGPDAGAFELGGTVSSGGTTTTTPPPTTTTTTTTTTPPPTTTSSPILGKAVIEATADQLAAGTAEAFRTTAAASGSVGTLNVYVDSGSAARSLIVGVYDENSSGNPGTLLATGALSSPKAGAWNAVRTTSSASIVGGRRYWIAILGTGGTLKFRDRANVGYGLSQVSESRTLTALPRTWSRGGTLSESSLSAWG